MRRVCVNQPVFNPDTIRVRPQLAVVSVGALLFPFNFDSRGALRLFGQHPDGRLKHSLVAVRVRRSRPSSPSGDNNSIGILTGSAFAFFGYYTVIHNDDLAVKGLSAGIGFSAFTIVLYLAYLVIKSPAYSAHVPSGEDLKTAAYRK